MAKGTGVSALASFLQYRSVQKKRVQNAVLGYNLKDHRKISCLFLRGGNPFSITVIQVYAPTTKAKEAEVERFYEQDLLELTPIYIFSS